MNRLSAVPFWVWLLISFVLTYGIWNPTGISLWEFWSGSSATSWKVLVGVIVTAIVSLYVHETWRSLGPAGLMIYAAFIGAVLWAFKDLGFFTGAMSSVQWWGQAVLAVLLTFGMQGGRIYRWMTGRVPVTGDPAIHDVHHS